MAKKSEFEEVLLPQWEEWDVNGTFIPGKDVTLKDGSAGSILVSSEGISVYKATLKELHEDELGHWIESVKTEGIIVFTSQFLTHNDVDESITVYTRFMELKNS